MSFFSDIKFSVNDRVTVTSDGVYRNMTGTVTEVCGGQVYVHMNGKTVQFMGNRYNVPSVVAFRPDELQKM